MQPRKINILLIISCSLTIFCATINPKNEIKYKGEDVVVTSSEALLRRGPGENYDKFAILVKGKTFKMISEQGNWFKILLPDGNSGWISKGNAQKVSRRNLTTITDTVVRKFPNENSIKIVNVNKGTELIQLDKTDSWFLIQVTEGVKGWIHKSALQIVPEKNLIVPEKAYIRKGPSKVYDIMETASASTPLTELDKKEDWFKVRTPSGNIGWVHQSVVKKAAYSSQKYSVSPEYITTNQDCNIRQGYSTKFTILKRVKKGTILLKIGTKNNWLRIKFPPDGRIGWIRSDLVDYSNEIFLTNQNCNIRQGYSKNFRVIRKASAGTPLARIESRGDWYRVYLPDATIGWIRNDLATELNNVLIANQNCNIRQGPGTNWERIEDLKAGTIVTQSRKEGDWYRIRQANNEYGWIRQDLLVTVFEYLETNDKINIREGPGTNHRLVKQVPERTGLYRISSQGNWLQVRLLTGGKGWVRGDLITPGYHGTAYLDRVPSEVTSYYRVPSTSSTVLMTVTETKIRMGPGFNYAIFIKVDAGTELIKLSQQGDWYEVKLPDGNIGFVHYSVFFGAGQQQTKGKLYTIERTNVRRAPDTTSTIITTLATGTTLSKISQRENWSYVRLNDGSEGWIFSPLLSSKTTKFELDNVTMEYGTLKTLSSSNIRTGPGLSYKVIETIPVNRELTKIGHYEDWYQILLKNNEPGWISEDIVEDVTINSIITIAPTAVKEYPQSDARTIDNLSIGIILQPKEIEGEWYAITTPSNKGGWVEGGDVEKLKYSTIFIRGKSNVRRAPNPNASILKVLEEGAKVEPISEKGEWYFIVLPDGSTGWISKSIVSQQYYPRLKITNTANAYSAPSINSDIISMLKKGDEYQSVAKQGEWYKIILIGGDFGWVYSSYYEEILGGSLLISENSNIREGPGLEYKIIAIAKAGDKLKCLTEKESWSQVLTPDGKMGWVRKDLSRDISFTPVVTIRQTHIRSGPGDDFARLATFNTNKRITPINQKNDWYEFKLTDTKKGWVKKTDCIKKAKSRIVFTLDRSNLREGPGKNYNVIKQLDPATDLMVIGESGDWYKVKLMNAELEGWIMKDLIFE